MSGGTFLTVMSGRTVQYPNVVKMLTEHLEKPQWTICNPRTNTGIFQSALIDFGDARMTD